MALAHRRGATDSAFPIGWPMRLSRQKPPQVRRGFVSKIATLIQDARRFSTSSDPSRSLWSGVPDSCPGFFQVRILLVEIIGSFRSRLSMIAPPDNSN
jgi:hypothetical protein